jgi:hypothetical protein
MQIADKPDRNRNIGTIESTGKEIVTAMDSQHTLVAFNPRSSGVKETVTGAIPGVHISCIFL